MHTELKKCLNRHLVFSLDLLLLYHLVPHSDSGSYGQRSGVKLEAQLSHSRHSKRVERI
jgi:hypothetical protein